ncbi:MAG: tetratricopeptide repeat protein, partial [Polyangiaceae bacterium]
VAATTAAIAAALKNDAITLHARGQRDQAGRAELEGAAGLYGVYLSRFGDDPKAYEVHFNLAELDFFRLGRNVDAATHYMAAARAIPPSETSGGLAAMRHDALYNALVALSREMDAGPRETPSTPPGSDATKGRARTDSFVRAADQYAEALDLYAEFYPGDPELPAMFYRQGRYYFERGNYDSAVKIWGMLLEKFPNSAPSHDAGDSILESFSRAKNYANIETWARRLKALPTFGAQKQQERLNSLIVTSVFKQGEQTAASGNHAGAAKAYLRAAKEFPGDARAAQACVDAEQEAKLAGDAQTLEEAAHVAMGPAYKDRPESPTGAWIAATTLQSMGLFDEAAAVSEQMAALGDRDHLGSYVKFEHEKDAAYNAVILREATGDHARAVDDGARFLA